MRDNDELLDEVNQTLESLQHLPEEDVAAVLSIGLVAHLEVISNRNITTAVVSYLDSALQRHFKSILGSVVQSLH